MLRLILSALVLASTMLAQPHAQASQPRGEPRASRSTSVVEPVVRVRGCDRPGLGSDTSGTDRIARLGFREFLGATRSRR